MLRLLSSPKPPTRLVECFEPSAVATTHSKTVKNQSALMSPKSKIRFCSEQKWYFGKKSKQVQLHQVRSGQNTYLSPNKRQNRFICDPNYKKKVPVRFLAISTLENESSKNRQCGHFSGVISTSHNWVKIHKSYKKLHTSAASDRQPCPRNDMKMKKRAHTMFGGFF